MTYAVIINEIEYSDIKPYGEYDKTRKIWDYLPTLDQALETARQLQRDEPHGYRYEVIEVGTRWTI